MNYSQNDFLKLYEPIHESFARFCHARAYGVMEPEDLISESVLKALEKFHTLKNPKAFLAFMFTIAKNIAIKKYRRQKFSGYYNEHNANQIHDVEIDAETKLDIEVLYQALNTLPDKQKEAVVLFEISGFSVKEVAEIQASGESAVKQRLKRGREALADFFKLDKLKEEKLNTRSATLMSIFL